MATARLEVGGGLMCGESLSGGLRWCQCRTYGRRPCWLSLRAEAWMFTDQSRPVRSADCNETMRDSDTRSQMAGYRPGVAAQGGHLNVINSVKIVLIALATVAGAFAAVAQAVDYLTTGKLSILLMGIVLILSAVPIVVIAVIMVRQGRGSSFSWNIFRVVAATSATVATLALGTTMVIAIISVASSARPVTAPPPSATTTAPPVSTAPPPPTTSPLPAPLVQVDISQPAPGITIQPRQDVPVAGSVTGLAGDTLWVVTKPDAGDGLYYLTLGGPVTDHDGNWSFTDPEVGDDSDRGHNIVYFALQANRACSETLAVTPRNVNGDRTFALLPAGCSARADRPVAVVR